ncbi:MAG TPA: VWA domain-containing protein, partial [Candidatus Methylacidiphilales bacterium]|nr:VWA domain-containing protein [Candidatus Methylacidiphilales bacterium]
LLYLAKARLGRAVDGAALAAVGNFNRSSDATVNRDDVALIMRNFAVANFTSLGTISSDVAAAGGSGGTPISTTGSNGQPQTSYQYNFNDGTQDANGQFRRFVQVTLNTGSGGNITSATCNARCPVQTYFIGYGYYFLGNGQSKQYAKIGGYSGPSNLVDLKVSSSAVATRNPRLIEVVIDRSASMLANQGGASGLPPAIVQFLDFFDTSSDNIGIVSFGSAARVEMPITTNFLIAGTNDLIDAYNTVTNSPSPAITPYGVPGMDPEIAYESDYATNGVRRLKFGGATCADDGIRLGLEQMMANAGFNDPDVVKYLVIFTDGKWNTTRTLFAAPGYTNIVTAPTGTSTTAVFLTNYNAIHMANGAFTGGPQGGGPWSTRLVYYTTNLVSGVVTTNSDDTNLVPMPTLSPLPYVTNAILGDNSQIDFTTQATNHTSDTWLSADGINEPIGTAMQIIGAPQTITNSTWVAKSGTTNYYTHSVDVWLQPGSVAYYKTNNATAAVAYVSDYTNPEKHVNLYLGLGGSVKLVVPPYIVDGNAFDGLDLGLPDANALTQGGETTYPHFNADNFQEPYEWPDDANSVADSTSYNYTSTSLQRQLMFRNYVNLLTGFYVFKPDCPNEPESSGTNGYEPLITEQNPPGAPRPLWGLGPYYPSAPFYWPFGGETNNSGWVTNAVGIDFWPTYALLNPSADDPDQDQQYIVGGSRHGEYSINMLSTNAAPEWAGELFYKSTTGGGTNAISGLGSTPASEIMQSADWQAGLPQFATIFQTGQASVVMKSEATHNSNIAGSPSVWRPLTYNGSNNVVGSATDGGSATGGYVMDGNGTIYKNAMAWSGRPTHYYDFSKASWEPIADNHTENSQFLQLGIWKAQEYAWHARALGVTIYTVGYGKLVDQSECTLLAQIANSTNVITTNSSGAIVTNTNPYNPSQPIGQQFYATNADMISNDFYSVGQAINEALTGGQ